MAAQLCRERCALASKSLIFDRQIVSGPVAAFAALTAKLNAPEVTASVWLPTARTAVTPRCRLPM